MQARPSFPKAPFPKAPFPKAPFRLIAAFLLAVGLAGAPSSAPAQGMPIRTTQRLPSAAVISASRFRLSGAGEAVSGIKVSYREIAAFGATYTTLANALASVPVLTFAPSRGGQFANVRTEGTLEEHDSSAVLDLTFATTPAEPPSECQIPALATLARNGRNMRNPRRPRLRHLRRARACGFREASYFRFTTRSAEPALFR